MLGLSFIVILVATLGMLFKTGQLLKSKIEISSHCVHQVLRLQKRLSKPLEQLIRLNPQATRLRIRRIQAQAQLAAAVATGNAILAAKARAEILIVDRLQAALNLRQNMLLQTAHFIRREFYQTHRTSRQFSESEGLALTPEPPTSPTPNYEPTLDFHDRQGQTLLVATQNESVELNYACSATLEVNTWKPILKKVKANWR